MPDQQKRTPIISERSPPARVFDIFLGEHVIDYYADGTARMSLGPEVSKIEFVRSMGPIEEEGLSVDQRDIFLRVAMPTSALIELCAVALEHYGKLAEGLEAGAAFNRNTVREALKRAANIKL